MTNTDTNTDAIHTVRYLTDDRDQPNRHELLITMGGNGDWYISVAPEGQVATRGVRICTSGGAARAVPGLGVAIAQAFRALLAAQKPAPRGPKRYVNLATCPGDDSFMEVDQHKLDAADDGYRWVPNPAYDTALYEYDPSTGNIRKRLDA